MKRIFVAVCCLSLFSIPCLAAQHHHAKNAEKNAAAATMSDQQFVDFAAQTDMVEANLGQLAQDVAAAQNVKDYGKMVADDHTADYHQLEDAAKQAGLTVPTAIDAEHNKMLIGPMHQLKGKDFDHKYIDAMIKGHTEAVAIYKKEAMDAQNEAIKNYADMAVPVLEKHLDAAKDIAAGKPANTQP